MNRYVICILACLTLGLAPFLPEPHLVEKVRRVANGAEGMRPIDWFDLVLHASPWIVLLGLLVHDAIRGISRRG